jgi:hypothetical protein
MGHFIHGVWDILFVKSCSYHWESIIQVPIMHVSLLHTYYVYIQMHTAVLYFDDGMAHLVTFIIYYKEN